MKKYVLITGVSGGMGLETAKKFIENDYIVFGLDIVEPKITLDNLIFYKVDLTDSNQINEVYNKISNLNIKFDSIINTAGIYNLDSLIEISEEQFIKIFIANTENLL